MGLALAGMARAAEPVAETRTLSFSRRSKPVATKDLSSLTEKIAARKVRVFEPYEEREVTFEAIPLNAVLDAIYGEEWRQEQELLMTCKDGYQPSIPVRRALDHKAWIAFDRTDQEEFDILKLESGRRQRIDVSPFYLIWENLDDQQVREDGDYGWPYQLVAIDLIQPRLRFPASAPPDGASQRATAGYESFRMYCGKCHAVNGEGGVLGPELNYPVSPVEYWKRDWLRKWIDDPSRIRPATRMPGLSPAVGDRVKTIDDILAYLDAMTGKKIAPENGG